MPRRKLTYSEIRGLIVLSALLIAVKAVAWIVADRRELPAIPSNERTSSALLEINSADSLQFDELPGIGPVYASRIVRFRNLLGGYYSVDQLSEVYGLDSTWVASVKSGLTVDTTLIVRMDVNSFTFKELLRHPYLDYEQVKSLVNYRDRHGSFLMIETLSTAGVLPDSVWTRIRHYLKV